jgi:hypothetical protein
MLHLANVMPRRATESSSCIGVFNTTGSLSLLLAPEEISEAKRMAKRMRDVGWRFAVPAGDVQKDRQSVSAASLPHGKLWHEAAMSCTNHDHL